MITLEWLKEIAENLRLGLYKSKNISFTGTQLGGVVITDIDNNICLELVVNKHKDQLTRKTLTGKTIETSDYRYYCNVHGLIYYPKSKDKLEFVSHRPYYTVEGKDYSFWADFAEWIRQQREDRAMQAELKAIEAFTL